MDPVFLEILKLAINHHKKHEGLSEHSPSPAKIVKKVSKKVVKEKKPVKKAIRDRKTLNEVVKQKKPKKQKPEMTEDKELAKKVSQKMTDKQPNKKLTIKIKKAVVPKKSSEEPIPNDEDLEKWFEE